MSSINHLKNSEYKEGARLAFENFKDLFIVSESAGKSEKYGIASALCVLAFEELAKSIMLEIKSINKDIPITKIYKYFKQHEPKQNLGITLILMSLIDSINNKDSTATKISTRNSIVLTLSLFVIAKYLEKDPKNNITELDRIKMSGFYIDYSEENDLWESPSTSHDKKSFEMLLHIIKAFSIEAQEWIFNGNLNEQNVIAFVEDLGEGFIDVDKLKELKKRRV